MGTQNDTAYASACGGRGRERVHRHLVRKGARVASMREPRTMMPWGVSPTPRGAMSSPAEGTSPFALSVVGFDDRVREREVAAPQELLVLHHPLAPRLRCRARPIRRACPPGPPIVTFM